jgi:hypothetical protein
MPRLPAAGMVIEANHCLAMNMPRHTVSNVGGGTFTYVEVVTFQNKLDLAGVEIEQPRAGFNLVQFIA